MLAVGVGAHRDMESQRDEHGERSDDMNHVSSSSARFAPAGAIIPATGGTGIRMAVRAIGSHEMSERFLNAGQSRHCGMLARVAINSHEDAAWRAVSGLDGGRHPAASS
jgi:hypothetical protein